MTFTWTFAYIQVMNNNAGVITRIVQRKIAIQKVIIGL